jgi:hypothetical protein
VDPARPPLVSCLIAEGTETAAAGAVVDVLRHEAGGQAWNERDGQGERARRFGHRVCRDVVDLRRRSQRRHQGRGRFRSSTSTVIPPAGVVPVTSAGQL